MKRVFNFTFIFIHFHLKKNIKIITGPHLEKLVIVIWRGKKSTIFYFSCIIRKIEINYIFSVAKDIKIRIKCIFGKTDCWEPPRLLIASRVLFLLLKILFKSIQVQMHILISKIIENTYFLNTHSKKSILGIFKHIYQLV